MRKPTVPQPASTRRVFLRRAATAAQATVAGSLLVDLAGCGTPVEAGPPTAEDVFLALYQRDDFSEPLLAAQHAFGHLDTSWLAPGDSVLLKVASNSGEVHPAVTAPSSVRGVVRALKDLGAGRVIVADQAGVQQVRLVEGERRFSSTRAIFERNGLLAAAEAAEAELAFFDDAGFENGYFEATLPAGHHWSRPMMLPNVVREVDHILYLPRITSHVLAGYSHATKIAIGWLRDDSRNHLHHDAATFYEKYVEINFAEEIASRLRGSFTFVEKLQLHQGPDAGTVLDADPLIAVGSASLGHHDALTAAMLSLFNAVTPPAFSGLGYGPLADAMNWAFLNVVVEESTGIPWGPDGPAGYTSYVPHHYPDGVGVDRALTRCYELLGGVPPRVPVRFDGQRPSDDLLAHLAAYSGGLFDLGALEPGDLEPGSGA